MRMFDAMFRAMTDKELQTYLTKRGVRGAEARAIRERFAEQRAELRRNRARIRAIKDLWKGVLHPLVNEQRSVRAMLAYESKRYPNPERREALKAYEALLKKVKLKLREYRYYAKRTPKEQAEREREKGKIIPNDGAHWTDWVPAHIKQAVAQAFADIPRAAKARVKTPFERTIRKSDNIKLRKAYADTARRKILDAEQELTMIVELHKGEPSEAVREAQAKVAEANAVLDWLLYDADDAFIPATWGELLVQLQPLLSKAQGE